MSDPRVIFSARARRDLRRVDAPTRTRIVAGIDQSGGTRVGDVKRVQIRSELRIRIGTQRVFFRWADDSTVKIDAIGQLREAHRRPWLRRRFRREPVRRQAAQEPIPNSRLISASVKTRPALWSASPSSIARISSSVNSSSNRLARRRKLARENLFRPNSSKLGHPTLS